MYIVNLGLLPLIPLLAGIVVFMQRRSASHGPELPHPIQRSSFVPKPECREKVCASDPVHVRASPMAAAAVVLAILVSPSRSARRSSSALPRRCSLSPITQLDAASAASRSRWAAHLPGFLRRRRRSSDILLLLVRDTRLSVIPDPSLDQTFIGDLKNVTIREALDLILEPLGLDYSVRGQVIRVFPRELETRFYSIDYVITQRSGSRSIAATTGAGGSSGVGVGGGLQSSIVAGGGGGAASARAAGGAPAAARRR